MKPRIFKLIERKTADRPFIIKRYPGTVPKPLDDSVAKASGNASEMARHIREGRKPERKDVELIVGLAAYRGDLSQSLIQKQLVFSDPVGEKDWSLA